MTELTVYDPPMCCSTGVCGPDANDSLARFAADMDWASRSGIKVARYNLGHQPGAFATNPNVRALLESDGLDCLPLVFVDGRLMRKGGYPSRDELAAALALQSAQPAAATACCGGAKASKAASGCC